MGQVDLSGTRADLAAEKESLSAAAGQCQSLTEQLDRVRQGLGSNGPR